MEQTEKIGWKAKWQIENSMTQKTNCRRFADRISAEQAMHNFSEPLLGLEKFETIWR